MATAIAATMYWQQKKKIFQRYVLYHALLTGISTATAITIIYRQQIYFSNAYRKIENKHRIGFAFEYSAKASWNAKVPGLCVPLIETVTLI